MTEPRRRLPNPLGGEDGLPFSKGVLARALITSGVPPGPAYELALRVASELAASGEPSLEYERLEELARGVLGEEAAARAVRRLQRSGELPRLDLPIIVLVGGSTGTGKSTVATEVAHRLGITRVTSTDFIRQTMRAFFSREFMPSIHYSSFEASRGLGADDPAGGTVAAFLNQTRNVLVGVRAVLDRALQEGWSMVLEGVHLVPGMLPPVEGALVVHCILRIDDRGEHSRHFWVRDTATEGLRPVARYLESLDDIRAVQDAIVQRARRHRIAVIENSDIERTIGTVLELVLSSVENLERVGQHG